MSLIDVHKSNLRKRHRRHRQHSQKSVETGSLALHVALSAADPPSSHHSHHSQHSSHHSSHHLSQHHLSQHSQHDLGAELSSPSFRGPASGGGVPMIINFDRQLSFSDQDDIMPPVALLSHQRSFTYDDIIDTMKNKPELTLFSEEEGIADMDLPDHLFMEELEYLDNITSCNKVENCLMLSEYEQNLIKETESPPTKPSEHKRKKWSMFRQSSSKQHSEANPDLSRVTIGVGGFRQNSYSGSRRGAGSTAAASSSTTAGGGATGASATGGGGGAGASNCNNNSKGKREIPTFPNTVWRLPNTGPKRSITVIEEASV